VQINHFTLSEKSAAEINYLRPVNAKQFKRHTVTAALPYANGPVHIGHLAGCYLPADIYVRYLKARGEDVIFICGSDEHGVPITLKAKKEGITPQQVVDKYHSLMKNAFTDFGIDFTFYGRTTSKTHHETSQQFFKKLYDDKQFREIETEQYYDEKAGTFLADRYITGTCPICGNDGAYGDQCEKCGSTLNPTDLINPKSTLSGEKPSLRKTKNWFLPLDELSPMLQQYIESHPEWKSNVKGQCMSWIKQGLQPRAMTRDLDWGVKVPLPGTEGKVLYVWFDAPIGYISNTREYFESAEKGNEWEKYWKDPGTRLLHFIGKDNIVFHCLIFQAMLKLHGGYINADNVPANEFLNLEGDKISTSRNWAVWLHEYLQELPGKQDELRYVLASIAPETSDSEFTWKDYQARVNNELNNNLGNFINRVMTFAHKHFEGKVPETDADRFAIANKYKDQLMKINELLSVFRFREALSEIMAFSSEANAHFQQNEPWKITDKKQLGEVIYDSLQYAVHLAFLIEPFLPATASKLHKMLNTEKLGIPASEFWKTAHRHSISITPGHQLSAPQVLFEKISDEAIEKQVAKLLRSKEEASAAIIAEIPASKPPVTFDDFAKMDIRVGTILEAAAVPKTDKLLKLLIDTGIDKRTVVSGIAEYFKPEEIIGQQVSILVNLQPRMLKGIESQGMILMAKEGDGRLVFVQPAVSTANGSSVS
jgi:methionyl-tRNA synthetase